VTSNRIDPTPFRTPEWDHAWQLVRRLASARGEILVDAAADKPAESTRTPVVISASTGPINDAAAADPEEFARAVAEIEQASAALRQAEPALDGAKPRTAKVRSRRPHSVWLFIATLWLSTALVIAGAVTAIAYFIH
jgi:hypothetical protein